MDRRRTIQWMLAAAASMPLLDQRATSQAVTEHHAEANGYGTDPNLTKLHGPGDIWPLTLDPAQRRCAAALCNVILPADGRSPSAESVGMVDFLDEWVSAPYPHQREDRAMVLQGLAWMDAEGERRFQRKFADLDESKQHAICDDICHEPKADAKFVQAARFFNRYRDLVVGGFYSTAAGRQDLGYMGNVPMANFEGPPIEVLRKLGLDSAAS